jgi:hypothetical protein
LVVDRLHGAFSMGGYGQKKEFSQLEEMRMDGMAMACMTDCMEGMNNWDRLLSKPFRHLSHETGWVEGEISTLGCRQSTRKTLALTFIPHSLDTLCLAVAFLREYLYSSSVIASQKLKVI